MGNCQPKLVDHAVYDDVVAPESNEPLKRPIAQEALKNDAMAYLNSDNLTTVYNVPNDEFQNETEVLKHHNFVLGKELGAGGFATVYEATHTKTNTKVACKVIDLGDGRKKSLLNDMKNELSVMEKVNHPFIVHLYTHFLVNNLLFIFMQLANGGTLSRFVRDYGPFTESESRPPFCQILSGVSHMHKLHIAHRDIKLSNILLMKNQSNEYNILLADFGLSREAYNTKQGVILNKTYCGTPVYMAPEISGKKRYNAFLVDVWACGVILFFMVNLEYPFDTNKLTCSSSSKVFRTFRFAPHVNSVSSELHDLLKKIFQANPRKRISLRKVITHPWLADEYQRIKRLTKKREHAQR